MTNGEKIKEIFPESEIIPQYISDLGLTGYDVCIDGETYFSREWWNMEYQEPCEDWRGVPSDEMTLEQARQAVKDLRKMFLDNWMQEPITKNDLRIDCISREAVLALFNKSDGYNWEMSLLKSKIRKMPSVIPQEPKRGHWIFTKTIFDKHGCTVECSSCHKKWKTYDEIRWKKEINFCPKCGTEMESGK